MGTTIEIYLPTVDDKEIEGIVADLIVFLREYKYEMRLREVHKTWKVS